MVPQNGGESQRGYRRLGLMFVVGESNVRRGKEDIFTPVRFTDVT